VSIPETLYEATLAAARPAIFATSLAHAGTRRAVQGRRDSLERFRTWSARERDVDRPLVWVHAPSVGEALMAQAIIAALREARPDAQVAFTHFSPSAERMVEEVGADVWGYVPFDTRGPVRRALRVLQPRVIAFVRTEVWPVLTREAAKAGASQLLVNAVLSEGSGRLRWLGRSFLEAAYRRLSAVGAVSEAHADRYELLGVPPGRVRLTGDARFDQVWRRIEERGLAALRGEPDAADRVPGELRPIWRLLDDPDAFTLVAGSTWPADEKVLAPALTVLGRTRALRLIIAPHEPTEDHLEGLERRLDRRSLRHARLSALLAGGGAAPPVVLVDRMGILADLYALADAAYVGGGFGKSGLHSVVEPAALGVPVLFGPAHGNAREAGALAAAGGGFVVEGAAGFEDRLRELMDREGLAASTGAKARAYVRSETGAAARNATLIVEQLEARTHRSRVR
jgi:3-deoxy-D-manno-octulosonic-acid transferase